MSEKIEAVKKLINDMSGFELQQVKETLSTDWQAREAHFKAGIEKGISGLKQGWAELDTAADRQTFKIKLQDLSNMTRATWHCIDQLEQYEKARARAETRAKLQTALSSGLTFERITIDGELFHTKDGLVVEGLAVDDVPF